MEITNEENKKYNRYTNFWNFLSVMIVFFMLNNFLDQHLHIVIVSLIQLGSIILLYSYVNPYLGDGLKKICIKTKIPLWSFYAVFLIIYYLLRY